MTSRLTSEARMPSVPIVMPSEMETVLNSSGVPPAARMPSLTCSASVAQVVVARPDLDPGVGHPDERPSEIVVGEPGGAQHGARPGAGRAVSQRGAAPLQRIGGTGHDAPGPHGPTKPRKAVPWWVTAFVRYPTAWPITRSASLGE